MFMLQYRLDSRTAYTDTDSIIASGTEPLDNMSIDPTKLGSFKIEEAFKEFTAIKKKNYALKLLDDSEVVASAGIPNNLLTYADLYELYKNNKIVSKDSYITKFNDEKLALTRCKITYTLNYDSNNLMKVYDEAGQ
jgi:hypothetical protein